MPIDSSLRQAIELHRAGRLLAAEQLYRQVLQQSPEEADAWHLYALLARQSLRTNESLRCAERALELAPGQPRFALTRANMLLGCGRMVEAESGFRPLLECQAVAAEATAGLALALIRQGRSHEADLCLAEAIRQGAGDASIWNDWGLAWQSWQCWDEARVCFEQALRLQPELAAARSNLGNCLQGLGRSAEAIEQYRAALRVQPDLTEVLVNLGTALQDNDRIEEAIDRFREALRLRPDLPEAHSNLGYALEFVGRHAEAIDCYQTAIRLRPDYVQAHWNLALARLRLGDWVRGWPEFEWRWRKPGVHPLSTRQPIWPGEPLEGRTILLHDEQGHGDTLQFVRYVPLVKQRGGRVIVRAHRLLLPLLRRSFEIDGWITREDPLPTFDTHLPLMSLPAVFGTTPETVPAPASYLRADPQRVEHWRNELGGEGLRVGIVWRGNPDNVMERFRTVPLECFASLAEIPGVRLFSLQKERVDGAPGWPLVDLSGDLSDFAETAAVVSSLDLVITSDTAMAHLAGGLGTPVWLALAWLADWRWLQSGETSPWYPQMRIFRQRHRAAWPEVFEAVAACLRNQVSGPASL